MKGNKEIIIASLFGSQIATQVPAIEKLEQALSTHILPPIPFLPIKKDNPLQEIKTVNIEESKAGGVNYEGQFWPLSFKRNGVEGDPWYTFPYEPILNISGSNTIVKRKVAKGNKVRGTVKERWSEDDEIITITGVFIGNQFDGSFQDAFPIEDFEKLRDFCKHPRGLAVKCDILQALGINYIVVEEFSFPFTTGENVQAYELKCVSDFTSEILLEIED